MVLEKTRVPWTARLSNQSSLKGNQQWILIGRTDAKSPILCHIMWRAESLEKILCWERLKAKWEGSGRGWYGWMVSLTQWTWVWANSGREWRTGKSQFSSVAQLCLTLCDPMDHSLPGHPIHHQLPGFTQTHIHWVSDAIQPSHPLSSPSPPALNLSQHQGLFKWVSSSHQVAKVLEFQL